MILLQHQKKNLTIHKFTIKEGQHSIRTKSILFDIYFRYKKCIRDLFKAFENKPFQTYEADIHYHLGISFANLDFFDKAIEPLSRAIDLAKYEPCYIHERAKCYLLVDENERALKDYNEVIRMQPKNSHAYFGRAFAHKALK